MYDPNESTFGNLPVTIDDHVCGRLFLSGERCQNDRGTADMCPACTEDEAAADDGRGWVGGLNMGDPVLVIDTDGNKRPCTVSRVDPLAALATDGSGNWFDLNANGHGPRGYIEPAAEHASLFVRAAPIGGGMFRIEVLGLVVERVRGKDAAMERVREVRASLA